MVFFGCWEWTNYESIKAQIPRRGAVITGTFFPDLIRKELPTLKFFNDQVIGFKAIYEYTGREYFSVRTTQYQVPVIFYLQPQDVIEVNTLFHPQPVNISTETPVVVEEQTKSPSPDLYTTLMAAQKELAELKMAMAQQQLNTTALGSGGSDTVEPPKGKAPPPPPPLPSTAKRTGFTLANLSDDARDFYNNEATPEGKKKIEAMKAKETTFFFEKLFPGQRNKYLELNLTDDQKQALMTSSKDEIQGFFRAADDGQHFARLDKIVADQKARKECQAIADDIVNILKARFAEADKKRLAQEQEKEKPSDAASDIFE